MQKYIDRLVNCGMSPDEAYCTCVSFMKDFTLVDLEAFVHSLEKDRYHVD